MQRVIQIHAGQNGEHIGLQRRDQHLETGKTDQRRERQQPMQVQPGVLRVVPGVERKVRGPPA